jgi:hypothetical protein
MIEFVFHIEPGADLAATQKLLMTAYNPKMYNALLSAIRFPLGFIQLEFLYSLTFQCMETFEMYDLPTKSEISYVRMLLGNLTKYVKICLVVKPLQFLFPSKPYEQKMEYMRSLPAHTVGHDLAKMLDSKGLKLIPGFAKHDLNHLILGYDMDPEEELCMQAYLIGNGHWELQCFLFLSSAVLLPGLWSTLWSHYNLGKRSEPLSSLSLEECMGDKTELVRRKYASPRDTNLVEGSWTTTAQMSKCSRKNDLLALGALGADILLPCVSTANCPLSRRSLVFQSPSRTRPPGERKGRSIAPEVLVVGQRFLARVSVSA